MGISAPQQLTESLFVRGTNGAIDITSSYVGGEWEVRTTNGRIRVNLPRQIDAVIDAETNNGKVSGNIPWVREYEGRIIKENSQGSSTLGDGVHYIKLRGSNGSIQVNHK
ncbi:hypothetical protein LGQ02_02350 [Bacillus shivajii]|uniref:hypothetical protein n=1 Tax=Bacillus shivajii TaxID=1983719 RepID=UPI001CFB9FB5|nr:hypothetical protein [Bacillus shivajii]UCZ53661.1 hypothetical protein LGQ02_02350 [Bacillus shivajii]